MLAPATSRPLPSAAPAGLDMLIDAYAAVLRDYLTRVQMLDFVV